MGVDKQANGRPRAGGGGGDRPPSKRRLAYAEHGASVLELVIVVSVLGIMVGTATSSMRGALARERIDGWARSMVYDIAAGRQAALTRRSRVTVSLTSTSYTIAALSGGTLRQATFPSDIWATNTCPANDCTFDRRGTPVDPAGVPMGMAGTVTLTSASTGRSYTIRIEPWTGRVSYSEP